jgi:hypothetical protein
MGRKSLCVALRSVQTRVVNDDGRLNASGSEWRYLTPTGAPCPRTVREDGSVQGSGACFGCGTCLLFGGLVEAGRR